MKIRKGQALESAIACGKYPAGGMAQVQEKVREDLIELTRMVERLDTDSDVTDFQQYYGRFVEAVVTGFYAFMFQGRIGAILALRVTCVYVFLSSHRLPNSNFNYNLMHV